MRQARTGSDARRDFPELAPMRPRRRSPPTRTRVLRLSLDARLQARLEARASRARRGSAPTLDRDRRGRQCERGNPRPGRRGRLSPAERGGAIDMSRAPRSPGSALKPFIYALAFENGIAHPETILFDRPARYGAYRPENFDLGFQGTVTARRALQMSLNLPAIELLADVGPAQFPRPAARRRARRSSCRRTRRRASPSGSAASASRSSTSRGSMSGSRAAARRRRSSSASTKRPPLIGPRRVTDPVAAYYVADILRGSPPPANSLSGRIAFKTGTSYGFRDALAIGFDKGATIAVWVGRPDNAPARAWSAASSPPRSCSTPSRGSGATSRRSRRPRASCAPPPAPICRPRCATCARTRPRSSRRPRFPR